MTFEEITTNYSWNTGTVIVPAYDARADTDEVVIDANMALILGGLRQPRGRYIRRGYRLFRLFPLHILSFPVTIISKRNRMVNR